MSNKSLYLMAQEVYANNVAHGWYETDRNFGMDVALLHSEVSEMLEEFRIHGMNSYTTETGKPSDVAAECADVLIRLLDTCHRYGIDLEMEYERKMAYNISRPYKHGKRV